jgi:hypothetical protein
MKRKICIEFFHIIDLKTITFKHNHVRSYVSKLCPRHLILYYFGEGRFLWLMKLHIELMFKETKIDIWKLLKNPF